MYGLKPVDLTYLQSLRGAEVIQVCVGGHDLQFHFHPTNNISVTGRCELLDHDGRMIDVWEDGRRSETFRFLELLGQTATDVTIDTPRSFKVTFGDGCTLRVVDDSDQYESFSVGNRFV